MIGVPDTKYGEELMACVIFEAGGRADGRRQPGRSSAGGKLAHYKIPRYVDVRESFPMTVSGKIRKVDMRQEAAARLGLQTGG